MSLNADEICRTNYENGRDAAVEPVGGLLVGMRVLRFDTFTLDQSRRAILRRGAEIELRSQSFDVLNHLVERAGQLVTKQELFDAIWGGAARTDDSLVQCIKDIRQALGDSDHRYIKTVHGRGYRFVAEVSDGAPPEAKPQADASLLNGRSDAADAPQSKWQGALIAASLLITALAGSGWLLWKQTRPVEPATLTMIAMPSIAVLPVKALGDDSDSALATLADEITTGLWRAPRGFNPDIRPPSAAKDAPNDARAMGRKLGVRYIAQTSARREGELVQVNVQLIEAESTRQVWVGPFEYRLGQPGAQNRAAARIGRTLAAELLRAEVRRPLPPMPGAAHLTMLGRALMAEEANARTTGEAIAHFEKAIAADPAYSLALAHYARAVATSSLNGWLPENRQDEMLAKAEDVIKRALKLEPDNAGAHLVHASVLRAKGDHEQAIAAFRHVLLLNPNFANAQAELGRSLIDVGRADEAIAEIQKAIALSPTDITLYMWYYFAGLASLHLGDHQGALDWLRKSHQANRAHDNTLRLMAVALADAGREAEAREKIKEFLKLRPHATLDDWKRPNDRAHPAVAAPREHFRATLQRLGVPESNVHAAAKP